MFNRWTRIAAAVATAAGVTAWAQDGSGVFFPEKRTRLYQTRHGEPAGYPGCIPGEMTTNKEGAPVPKYPKWGLPQTELYPGSVEHYRCETQKYLPVWPMQDVTSLVKNFRATEIAGVPVGSIEEYAEPVIYTPMYGIPIDTGKRNAPVKVVRMTTGAPVFKLDFGTLGQGLYCARLIGAAESKYVEGLRKPVYVELKVNDGANGETSRCRLRCGYSDDFYSVADFYFYAPAKRAYGAEMALGDGTQVDILAYNVDLHDMYAGLVRQPVKQRVNTFDLAQRDAMRAEIAKRVKDKDKAWLADFTKKNNFEFALGKPFRPEPLAGEARVKRDDELWYALPPANSQTYGQYGTAPRGLQTPEAKAAGEQVGHWTISRRWDTRWEIELVNKDKKVLAKYTYDDLAAHKPLPEPWPFREDAGGLTLDKSTTEGQPYPSTLCTIACFTTQRITEYTEKLTGRAAHWAGLANDYHFTGDREAARDAAMALARVAYVAPTWDESRLSVNAAVVGRTRDLNWGGKDQWTSRRLTRTDAGLYNQLYLQTYDRLFDYIQGNEELARAVNRYIPWIKTPADLTTFLDMNLLQYTAKRQARWHLHNNNLFTSVMAAGNTAFTRPWMEFLFRETYVYPNARAGMPDYATTSTTRDGTSYIGSWFYAMDGGAALRYAEETREYVERGGDAKFDMTDFRRFPKALAGCNFQIEGRAAGLHPLGVGDVNNPGMPYGHWFTLGSPEHQARLGWQWSKDPKYAYILANYFGPKEETPEEWVAIQKAAAGAPNPWFSQRSRVLSNWAAILEGGKAHTDYRFRRAAMVRVGHGWGHQHDDVLDLILWCHGVIHAAVGGERPEQRQLGDVHEPKNQASYTHNMVEVDGDGGARTGRQRGYSWARSLKDLDGLQYALAESCPQASHPYLSRYSRQVALIGLNDGALPAREPVEPKEFAPDFKLPAVEKTPDAYAFDVFRVAGGKRHTYCFHGCEEDEFFTNAVNARQVGFAYGDNADASPEARYLNKFVVADSKTAGAAPKLLEAQWRLQRGGDPVMLTLPQKDAKDVMQPTGRKPMRRQNTEQAILRANYDEKSPRKFTRLYVLDHEGDKVLTGKWVATSPSVSLQCLFVQRDLPQPPAEGEPGKLETVWPAIIEMYEGAQAIRSVETVGVKDNESDSARAVAVEVTTTDERKDLCFSDARPEKTRALANGVTVAGEFAFLSTDDKGLRQASLVGGTALRSPAVAITPVAPSREGKVAAVNYLDRKITVEGMKLANAALLKGAAVEIGVPGHLTSYRVKDAALDGGKAVLTLDKGGDYYSSRVLDVDEKEGVVRCGLGLPTDDSDIFPGQDKSWVASNDQGTKFWRAEYLSGTREDGYRFKLSGPVAAADFGEKGGLRLWEFGAGDSVRAPTHVALKRGGDGGYLLQADVECAVSVPGKTVEFSADGKNWKPAAKITEPDLGNGELALRVK